MQDLVQELEGSCSFLSKILERSWHDLAIILQELDKIFSKILLKTYQEPAGPCRIFQVLAQDPPRSSRVFQELDKMLNLWIITIHINPIINNPDVTYHCLIHVHLM
jgi:hypothetical protein